LARSRSITEITRRQLLRRAGATGMLALGSPALSFADGLQNQQKAPPVAPAQEPKPESQTATKYEHPPGVFINRPLTQISKQAEALLDEMEARACDYFYNEASPKTGLVRDHAPVIGRSLSRICSAAATGFGLSALCIAAKRHYLLPSQCEERVEKTLAFLLESCPHEHGFLYHFVDIETGERRFESELSSIDTSILLAGVLLCRQYFAGNTRIAALATTFYRRVDWEWMLNGGTTLSMGWLPDQGFLQARWDVYAELMTMYLMAIGSPSHPIPPARWDDLQRPLINFGGIEYISGLAPLFIHQYAHAWCDYRDQRDRHANYFSNSIAATRAHQLFCMVLGQKFPWLDQDLWGITASDSRQGYRVWGGPPAMGELDGTVAPCAVAGSLPFLPAETSHVLLNLRGLMGGRTWTRYGFVDALHPRSGWLSSDILGINQGISMLMAENLRTGFVWEYFMKNREITHAMREVAFHSDPDSNSQVL